MDDRIKKYLKQKRIAVVGSFRTKEKVAYRILLKLIASGRDVHPVNPAAGNVEGLKCYPTVGEIPSEIDAADIVTPPDVTENIVRECIKRDIKHIWLQPGAESKKAIDDCEKNGINVVYGACLMVEMDR